VFDRTSLGAVVDPRPDRTDAREAESDRPLVSGVQRVWNSVRGAIDLTGIAAR
jgi:hypothetical protein